jgi:hypothetical protein
MTVTDFDAQTGESVERDATADELAQQQADAESAAILAAAEAERAALAESARLKIAQSSGLTPEEITALGF